MRRYVATVTAVFAVVVLLVGVYSTGALSCDVVRAQPSCEVALLPGPIWDVLGLVTVEGETTYPSTGELLLTTVAVRDDLDLRTWWRLRSSDTIDLRPRSEIYPRGSDRQEISEHNAVLMADSQHVALLAALRTLDFDVEGHGAEVLEIQPDAVTDALETGDVIVAVDDATVRVADDVVTEVRSRAPGDHVVLTVLRNGGTRDVPVTLGTNPEDRGTAYVGVLLTSVIELPLDVTFDAGEVGGPSAGLMFALSVVELLEPEDLTAGAVVAGTGTISYDGRIGPVGGVKQKVAAASSREGLEQPASVFLVPQGQLAEAAEAPVANDVLLVPVATLDEALAALRTLAAGGTPAGAQQLVAPD